MAEALIVCNQDQRRSEFQVGKHKHSWFESHEVFSASRHSSLTLAKGLGEAPVSTVPNTSATFKASLIAAISLLENINVQHSKDPVLSR